MSIERVPETKEFNLKIALEKQKEGDFESCLKYLRTARDLDPDDADILGKMADVYYKIGAYAESSYIYALAFGLNRSSVTLLASMSAYWREMEIKGLPAPQDGIVCDSATEKLLDCDTSYGQSVQAIADRTDSILKALEKNAPGSAFRVKGIKELKARNMLKKAETLLRARKFKEACAEAEKITPDTSYYESALDIILRCSLLLGDSEKTEKYADIMIEAFPENVVGIELKLLNVALYGKDNERFKALFEKYAEYFLERKNKAGLKRIVMVAKRVGNAWLVKSGLSKIEELDPYDFDSAFDLTFAELAFGKLEKINDREKRLTALYDGDPRMAFLTYFTDWYARQAKLNGPKIPMRESAEYLFTRSCPNVAKEISEDYEEYNLPMKKQISALWGAIGSGYKSLVVKALGDLCVRYHDLGCEYCIKVLAHPSLDSEIKRFALMFILSLYSDEQHVLALVDRYRIRAITPKGYKPELGTTVDVIRTAYASTYTELVFSDVNVDSELLISIVDRMFSYFENRRKWKDETCCAVICAEYVRTANIKTLDNQTIAERYEIKLSTLEEHLTDAFGKR